MIRTAAVSLLFAASAGLAVAQPMDHSSMPGMQMPQDEAPIAEPADPHAGHAMPTGAPAEPLVDDARPEAADLSHEAAHGHAGHDMPAPAEEVIPDTPAPPPPTDHAADRDFDPAVMAIARQGLRREHGELRYSKVIAKLAEYQSRSGADGYRWDGQASFGGDINRLLLKSEGEGTSGEGVEAAELQALYSRAVTPYLDLHAGVRQDFQPRGRTYATVGVEGLFPYWLDLEGALFLSTKGELLARAEGSYDLRLTQRLILQPRAELNLAAQDTPATRTGSGLADAELGLRLCYEIRREFAPYFGISYDRRFGRTADYARAAGEDPEATSVVVGLRAWF